MMKKLFNFIIKYKYILLLVLLYVLFFVQMQNVQLYADDYDVIINNRDNLFIDIFNSLKNFFFYWSGRLLGHLIVVSGLSIFGIQFFRILNPIFLFFFCLLITKLIKLNNKIETAKLLFYISLFILGVDIYINRQLLYWTYSGVLYLWGYVPMLLIIYFIFDCYRNNKKISNCRLIISIILSIIVMLMMESSAIIIWLLLFLVNIKNRINDKKLFSLLIIITFCLILIFFLPGNLYRLIQEQQTFSFMINFSNKFSLFNKYILLSNGIFNMICLLSIILCIKNFNEYKVKNICIITFLLNILFFINVRIYNFLEFNWEKANDYVYIIVIVYLILNVYLLLRLKSQYSFQKYLLLSGIISTIASIILIHYQTERIYFPLIITFFIIIIDFYLDASFKNKTLILLTAIFLFNIKIGILCVFIGILLWSKCNKLNYVFFFIFCLLNLNNFFVTIYCYYQNSLIFNYNIKEINQAKFNYDNNIYLKKLKFNAYAHDLPETHDYILPSYKTYYGIENFNIIYYNDK